MFACPRRDRASLIRKAMFAELTSYWNSMSLSILTRRIHPIWEERVLNRSMKCKLANSYYHRYALNRGPSNELLFNWQKCDSPLCRSGCGIVENIDHIFIDCCHNEHLRIELRSICLKNNITFSIQSIFSNPKLQEATERFISRFHKIRNT